MGDVFFAVKSWDNGHPKFVLDLPFPQNVDGPQQKSEIDGESNRASVADGVERRLYIHGDEINLLHLHQRPQHGRVGSIRVQFDQEALVSELTDQVWEVRMEGRLTSGHTDAIHPPSERAKTLQGVLE